MALRKNPKTGVWEEVDEQKNDYAERFQRGFRGEESEEPSEDEYLEDRMLKKKASTWSKLKSYFNKQ